jgi:ferrochelatase
MRDAVLVMAYGTPASLEDVEAYYTDIRRGRTPPPELLEDLRARYRAIGGRSPLLEITRAQANGISQRVGLPAYVGMKHSPPWIANAVAEMARDGIERAAGLVLAPHYSSMSVGDYRRRAEKAAADVGWSGRLVIIESWHLEPGYIGFLAREVERALSSLSESARADSVVLFTAHSLPVRVVEMGDPYADQLTETADAVAARAGLSRWRTAWQSAGRTDVPWLGPDVTDAIRDVAAQGVRGIVVCPCGFVADHLEILYDVDIECRRVAGEIGVELARTASPNDDPTFLDALAAVASRPLGREP